MDRSKEMIHYHLRYEYFVTVNQIVMKTVDFVYLQVVKRPLTATLPSVVEIIAIICIVSMVDVCAYQIVQEENNLKGKINIKEKIYIFFYPNTRPCQAHLTVLCSMTNSGSFSLQFI